MAEKVLSSASRSSSASSTSSPGASSIRSWRQPMQPPPRSGPPKLSARVAECAGGTAAECAAVCCCCPCGLAGLLLCALIKLPAGLCRLAMRKRRKRRKSPALLVPSSRAVEERFRIKKGDWWAVPVTAAAPSPEIARMEREMWARFYGAGFWRSPSQREDR